MTKHCPTCNRDLPLPSPGAAGPYWWRDRSRPDGWMWQCVECCRDRLRAQSARWYATHAQQHKTRCSARRRQRRLEEYLR